MTDTALSRLGHQELLTELLERVAGILAADTAAVLLLDRTGEHLVATAAIGLEEEVAQGVSIPLGAGFAGAVAAQRRPVILTTVDASTVVSPVLLDKGIASMVGVPMIAGGEVNGVLHAGSLTPREFTAGDVELLQMAADRAASAVESIAARDDSAAAAALQRSLLPSALPQVGGAEFAARFIPGHGEVGGDWYDVFVLPSGQLGLVVGDVSGSGLQAAVVMGRMRSALRAYALESADPAVVLAKLDRKMQHFEPGALATVLYAVLDPGLEAARISCAGHPPPVVAAPGRGSQLAAVQADLMIGVALDKQRHATQVAMPPGGLLVLYTDGLVERRGIPLGDTLAQLSAAVQPGPAERVCSAVMKEMIGSQPATDDVAMLVFRRRGTEAGSDGLTRAGTCRPGSCRGRS